MSQLNIALWVKMRKLLRFWELLGNILRDSFLCILLLCIFTAFFELVSGNMEVTGEVSVDGPAWMNAGSVLVTSGGILNLNAETFRGDSFHCNNRWNVQLLSFW